jgi:capsular polysaccharide biosynthesis protein
VVRILNRATVFYAAAAILAALRLERLTISLLNHIAYRSKRRRPLLLALALEQRMRARDHRFSLRDAFFRQLHAEELPRRYGRVIVDAPPRIVEREDDLPAFGEEIPHAGRWEIPARYIVDVREATLVAATCAVFVGRTLLYFADEQEYPLYHRKIVERHAPNLRYVPALYERPDRHCESVILVAAPAAENLYHWLFECVPRVIVANRYREFDGLPLLVPAWLSPQLFDLLNLANVSEREVVAFEPDDVLAIDRLVVPWVPSVAPSDPLEYSRAVVDIHAAHEVRDLVLSRVGPGESSRLVYVSRRSFVAAWPGPHKPRNVTNDDEIADYIRSLGGKIVFPETLTMAAQIRMWNGADILVAPGGAALANLTFCKPGARVIMLCQNAHTTPMLFGILAQEMGVEMAYVAGPIQARPFRVPAQHDFTIPLDDLRRALEWAGAGQVPQPSSRAATPNPVSP